MGGDPPSSLSLSLPLLLLRLVAVDSFLAPLRPAQFKTSRKALYRPSARVDPDSDALPPPEAVDTTLSVLMEGMVVVVNAVRAVDAVRVVRAPLLGALDTADMIVLVPGSLLARHYLFVYVLSTAIRAEHDCRQTLELLETSRSSCLTGLMLMLAVFGTRTVRGAEGSAGRVRVGRSIHVLVLVDTVWGVGGPTVGRSAWTASFAEKTVSLVVGVAGGGSGGTGVDGSLATHTQVARTGIL